MNTLLSANVPDPTDFPPLTIAPGLRTLDGSLRCNICGELFDAPVTLNCGHCFCSFCVRSSLAEKQECPACRKTAIEGHLRPNPVMEEVVSAWKLSRPYILNLSKADSEQQQRDATPVATPKAKKRKIMAETGTRSGASTSSGVSAPRSPSKSKRTRQGSEVFFNTIPTSDADEDEMPEPSNASANPRPDDLVKCPMCTRRVKYKSINQHMDQGCKDPPLESTRSTMSDWKKLMAGPNKGKQKDTSDDEDNFPLPKASYATLKDRKLKEMLTEHGLPISGDRNQWIHRHQRWVMIYNANLDRSSRNRKTKQELRKELKKWEDEKAKKRRTTVEDNAAHEKRHKNEFAQLVDAARPRGDKGAPKAAASTAKWTAEQSKNNAAISLSGDKSPRAAQTEGNHCEREKNAIVVDSEEEREMVFLQRT